MSLARLAPDAEHDLRLPQLVPESRALPPEVRMDAPVKELLSIPEGEERDRSATQQTDPSVAAVDGNGNGDGTAFVTGATLEEDAVAAPIDNVGGDDTEMVNGNTLEEDFSEIAREDDITDSQAVEEAENMPSETERAHRLRVKGSEFPDVDINAPTFDGHEPDAPLPTVPNEGFRPYGDIPTDKRSYKHIDVKQTMSFFSVRSSTTCDLPSGC